MCHLPPCSSRALRSAGTRACEHTLCTHALTEALTPCEEAAPERAFRLSLALKPAWIFEVFHFAAHLHFSQSVACAGRGHRSRSCRARPGLSPRRWRLHLARCLRQPRRPPAPPAPREQTRAPDREPAASPGSSCTASWVSISLIERKGQEEENSSGHIKELYSGFFFSAFFFLHRRTRETAQRAML